MTVPRVVTSRRGLALACLLCGWLALGAIASAQDLPPAIEGLPASAPAIHPGAVVHFPAAPPTRDSALLDVPIPAGSNLRFMVDPASVSRAESDLVRYTLVVRTASGFRNISYEGLNCRDDTWHVYATWSQSDARWSANPDSSWLGINAASDSDVHAVLDRDYWCSGPSAAGDAHRLVQRLRRGMRPQRVLP